MKTLKKKYNKLKNTYTNSMSVFYYLYEVLLIIIGCALASFGTSCFLLPNHLSSGGFSGIATIFYYKLNVGMGTTIFILNIPFFLWSYYKAGKKFTIKTIFATILYSKLIDLFEIYKIGEIDNLLASLYGGVFVGIGLALVFKSNSSTGGTDLIAHILQHYNVGIRISNIITIVDFIIVFANLVVFKKIEIGLYSAISIFIIGKMIDIVFEGINFCKIIYIISDKHEEITSIINNKLKKGATSLYAKGSYLGENKMVIMCVSKRRDIEKIKLISKKIDINSFIIITDARDVYGLGFK